MCVALACVRCATTFAVLRETCTLIAVYPHSPPLPLDSPWLLPPSSSLTIWQVFWGSMEKLFTHTLEGKPVNWISFDSIKLNPIFIMSYRSISSNVLALCVSHVVVRFVARRRAPRAIPVVITACITLAIVAIFFVDSANNLILMNQLGVGSAEFSGKFGQIFEKMQDENGECKA